MGRAEEIAGIYERFLAGETEAVGVVRGWIMAVVAGGSWRFDDPEGIAQEVQIKLLRAGRAGRVQRPGGFQKLVYTVARCTCVDLYHQQRRRGEVELSDAVQERLAAPSGGAEARLEARERLSALRYVIQRLSPACRELWSLVYGERLPAREVGARLGLTAGNVRVRVHRCLEQARKIYRDLDGAAAGG